MTFLWPMTLSIYLWMLLSVCFSSVCTGANTNRTTRKAVSLSAFRSFGLKSFRFLQRSSWFWSFSKDFWAFQSFQLLRRNFSVVQWVFGIFELLVHSKELLKLLKKMYYCLKGFWGFTEAFELFKEAFELFNELLSFWSLSKFKAFHRVFSKELISYSIRIWHFLIFGLF